MRKNILDLAVAGLLAFILLSFTNKGSAHLSYFQQTKQDTGGWQQLYNGKDLKGWKHVGPGRMVIDDGLIRTDSGMGLEYYAGRKFGNCTIRVVFKMKNFNDN